MSFNFLLIFSITVFVASIIPGPSMLLALTHGMQYGARRTLASAMGNLTVTLIQASISIAGLGTILIASELVFQLIRWAGAAYLVYMGISIFQSPDMALHNKKPNSSEQWVPLRKLYLQGVFVTAGNPKAIVFFTAVFPQFINAEAAYWSQFAVMLGVGSCIAFSCFMIYAVGGQKIVSLFSEAAVGKYIKKIIGGTFIGAGIGLALSKK